MRSAVAVPLQRLQQYFKHSPVGLSMKADSASSICIRLYACRLRALIITGVDIPKLIGYLSWLAEPFYDFLSFDIVCLLGAFSVASMSVSVSETLSLVRVLLWMVLVYRLASVYMALLSQ